MKFADFITTKAIRAELQAQSKEAVIEELVQALLDAGEIDADQREDIVASIMKREELGSTGIGEGVAIPHCRTTCNRILGAVITLSKPVDYDAIDGEPVDLLFVLVVPPDETSATTGRPILRASATSESAPIAPPTQISPSPADATRALRVWPRPVGIAMST